MAGRKPINTIPMTAAERKRRSRAMSQNGHKIETKKPAFSPPPRIYAENWGENEYHEFDFVAKSLDCQSSLTVGEVSKIRMERDYYKNQLHELLNNEKLKNYIEKLDIIKKALDKRDENQLNKAEYEILFLYTYVSQDFTK